MAKYFFSKDKLYSEVAKNITKTQIVLDIGCGIKPQSFFIPLVHICCDPHLEYLNHLKNIFSDGSTAYIYLNSTWENVASIFIEKSVDSIFLVDVIEHINKDLAKSLILKLEKVARKQIIIFTPLGYLPQHHNDEKDAWGFNGAKWQEHVSGWQLEDFDDSWDLYICKSFHYEDNSGNKYTIPYGAFWAVKNINDKNKNYLKIIKRLIK